MMYYSSEARKSAVESIKHCIEKVSTIPGNVLSFNDSSMTIKYLNVLIDQIEKEGRKARYGENLSCIEHYDHYDYND